MNIAIILSGGVGTRMNTNIPKQYLLVNEKPIINYSIEKFLANPSIDEISVYRVKKRFKSRYKSWMKSLNLTFEDDLVFLSFEYFKSNFMQIHKGVYNLFSIST